MDSNQYNVAKAELAQKVTHLLDQLNIIWTINGKTLAGADKDGHTLPDDHSPFDIAVYHPVLLHSHIRDDKVKLLKLYMNHINDLLPDPLESRILLSNGYCIEIFNPHHGFDNHNSFYHVSIKITLLLHESADTLQLQSIPYNNPIPTKYYLPLSLIEYEGCIYQSPGNTKEYLNSTKNYINDINGIKNVDKNVGNIGKKVKINVLNRNPSVSSSN